MAKNATQVRLEVKGVNKTGSVFAQIARSAVSVGKTAALFGAAAATAATAAFIATAKALGDLSDVAMRASVTTDALTKMSTALNVLGIKANKPEQIAAAFQKMTKATGETGVEGFKKCAKAIAEMETAEERSAAAMAVFGKSGLDFMPIIEGIRLNGVGALEDIIEAMPGVSQSAADAGDEIADGWTIITGQVKSLWSEAIGGICSEVNEIFPGGVREAAMKAAAYMEYGAKRAWRSMKAGFQNIVKAYKAMSKDWGETFSQMWEFNKRAFRSWAKAFWGEIKNVGALLRDFFKEVWSGLTGNGFNWDNVTKNTNFGEVYDEFMREYMAAARKVNIFDDVDWSTVDDTDLAEALNKKLANAERAAAQIGQAAVGVAATEAADDVAEKVERAVRAARNEWMTADSYKGVTMAMRAEYGKGDKTTAAVNAVKVVNEKIKVATERTADVLESLEVA